MFQFCLKGDMRQELAFNRGNIPQVLKICLYCLVLRFCLSTRNTIELGGQLRGHKAEPDYCQLASDSWFRGIATFWSGRLLSCREIFYRRCLALLLTRRDTT